MDELNLDPSESTATDFEQPPLPLLSKEPRLYPGCCLSLSAPLLSHLCSLLPPAPSLSLSIGSGYGLLEALLVSHGRRVIGIEVSPSSNRYLPPDSHRTVYGSRALDPLANTAKAWLLVYPRRAALLDEYLHTHGKGDVERIIWAGPAADWEDYANCFRPAWRVLVQTADEVGGRAWEIVAVASKK
ncbi:hypothetical protein BDV96DRAFT_642869 [Lophiotrema nucula]|uniref:Methyltransferase domain-containing protein n=1 Tax=Lophiotrema nucula TaxID=690887 RepID=A0A6A5ZJS2_9PLEO|nr:hypothetical protein BDV96DRAFT_642869 [Lophiotrema nucula]